MRQPKHIYFKYYLAGHEFDVDCLVMPDDNDEDKATADETILSVTADCGCNMPVVFDLEGYYVTDGKHLVYVMSEIEEQAVKIYLDTVDDSNMDDNY